MRRASVFCVPVLLACGLLTFTVDDDSTTTVPGAGVVGGLLSVLDFTGLDDFDITIEQEMADQGVEAGDLETVDLSVLALHAEPDLSFLSSLDVYVSGEGMDEILVASGDSFPAGAADVELTPTHADLTDIVVAGGMAFRVVASGRAPEEDTDLDVHVEVIITATAQGACSAAKD